ncbi:MAG TPA: M55 family metallopeptidase [Candidatus Limnocylindrales bacterium]|nr:M55 family metallopeptidase [Candidatus Limnocylindrales bacterium]
MRVYISVDMEGVAGVSHAGPTRRGDEAYAQAVELMVGEANAAIAGAFAGGADEVTVNDSHGQMFNLLPERLDPRARLVQGTKPYSMVEAARDAGHDVALFVGYHARAGHPRGTIAHTYTGRITLVLVNGEAATEAALNAIYLGALGVPVAMVSGDDALADELRDWLPWAEAVAVKRAVSWQAADSLHPERARELIEAASRRAVERMSGNSGHRPTPLAPDPPLHLRIDFAHPGQADMAAVIPGFEREGDRGVSYTAGDALTLYRAFLSAARISRTADD